LGKLKFLNYFLIDKIIYIYGVLGEVLNIGVITLNTQRVTPEKTPLSFAS
jgi:hypothetical protein